MLVFAIPPRIDGGGCGFDLWMVRGGSSVLVVVLLGVRGGAELHFRDSFVGIHGAFLSPSHFHHEGRDLATSAIQWRLLSHMLGRWVHHGLLSSTRLLQEGT